MDVILAFSMGCLTPWMVLSPAEPNPLVGATHLDLAPLALPGDALVDLEVAEADEALTALEDQFAAAAREEAARCGVTLDPPGGPGAYTLNPAVVELDPGLYAVLVASSSYVDVVVTLTHRGAMQEQIRFRHGTAAATAAIGGVLLPANPRPVDRLARDGAGLGAILGQYVCSRVAGK